MYGASSLMQFRRQGNSVLRPIHQQHMYQMFNNISCIDDSSSRFAISGQYTPRYQYRYDLSTKGFPGSDFTPNTQLSGEGGIWDDGTNGYEWKSRYLEEKRSLANTYMNNVSRRTPIHEAVRVRARINRERLMRPLCYRYTSDSPSTVPLYNEDYGELSSSNLGRERTSDGRPSSLLAEALKIHHYDDDDYNISGIEESLENAVKTKKISTENGVPHSSSCSNLPIPLHEADVSGLSGSRISNNTNNSADEEDINSEGFLLMMDGAVEGNTSIPAAEINGENGSMNEKCRNTEFNVNTKTNDEWDSFRQEVYQTDEAIQSQITQNLSSHPGSKPQFSFFEIREQNRQKVRDVVDLVEEELEDLLSDDKCIAALSTLSEEELVQLRNEFFIEGIGVSGIGEEGPGLPSDGLPDSNEEMLREWVQIRSESSICHSYAGLPPGERRDWSPWYLRDIRSKRRYD